MSPKRTSCPHRNTPLQRRSRGFSMIELLSVASIAITAVGASVGSAKTLMLTQRLQGMATEVESSVQLARSHAISQGQTVYLAIQQQDGAACVLTHTGERGACTCQANGAAICQGEAELLQHSRRARSPSPEPISRMASRTCVRRRGRRRCECPS